MPRQARLDAPATLHHVIARGVERRPIFREDAEYYDFLARLESAATWGGASVFAWALIPNHFHLLLRTGEASLPSVMRRVMTGYAVAFNSRHKRHGHVFQNRYRSIVCEQERYLLALVRYIHLNPLRAGLVGGMDELDRYPWSGHAVLMGERTFDPQEVDEVLSRFGRTVKQARARYRVFVEEGISLGRQDGLVGGGLARSLGGEGIERGGKGREGRAYDERVLGGSEFVQALWRQEELRERLGPRLAVEEVVERLAAYYGTEPAALLRRSNRPAVAQARAVVSFLAVRELGHSGVEVGRVLKLKRAGVSLAAKRGEQAVANCPGLRAVILGSRN